MKACSFWGCNRIPSTARKNIHTNDKATKGKKYGTPIHKRVNTIVSVILGAKGSCGSGYGPTLSHQRSVIARSRTVRENSNAGGKGFGEKKVQLEELFAGKETMSMKSEEMMEEEKEDEEEVFELCKIRILLGKKCNTMNLSGELRYDTDRVLIPEDYIS
ncbi:hypothetical protein Droror1_Dr00012050 [Drosera rotundifolia]